MDDQTLVTPGDAKIEDVARGLLDVAQALGLNPHVVNYSPSKRGFHVPSEVAQAYASMQEETGDFGPVEPPAVEAGEHEGNATETGGEGEAGQPTTGEPQTQTIGDAQQVQTAEVVTATSSEPPKSLAEAQAAEQAAGPRRYTDEEKAQAVAAVEAGKTLAEAAEEIGASATSVAKWVAAAKSEGGAV